MVNTVSIAYTKGKMTAKLRALFARLGWGRHAGYAGLAGLALLGALLVLARQINLGVGLDFDSATYVHIARLMQTGEPLLDLDGAFYTIRPPLYPAMLAAASVGVFDPLNVAGVLNAALFGAMVLLCGTFLRRRLAARPLWAWCGCLAVAVSPVLGAEAAKAMATQPFALFVAGALIGVAKRDPGWCRLVFAAMCTAFACMTHYTGIALPAVVCVSLLVSSDLQWTKRLWRVTACAVISAVPLGLWLLRNQILAGSITGERSHNEPIGWLVVLRGMGDHMTTWVFLDLPLKEWFGAGWPVLLASVALFALGVVALRERISRGVWRPVLVFGGFVVAHSVLILTALAVGRNFSFEARYVTALCVPCLLVVWLLVGDILTQQRRAGTRPTGPRSKATPEVALVALVALVVAPWLAWQGVMNMADIVEKNLRGYGFDAPRWRDSETLRNLRGRDTGDRRVYASFDHGHAAFFHAGIAPTHYYCGSSRRLGRDGDYLIWLRGWRGIEDRCLLAGEDDVFTMSGLELVEDYADGVLLRFNAASTATLADAVWAHLVPNVPPMRSAPYGLWLNGERRELVFTQVPCATLGASERFFVHVYPYSTDALPAWRRQFDFDNLDFDFPQRGLLLRAGTAEEARKADGRAGRCVAVVELPGYPMRYLRVGQFAKKEPWAVRIDLHADDGSSSLRWSSRSEL